MSENNQFHPQSSIYNTKAAYSLQDQTLTKIAIQICQYSDFKKYILNKPKQCQTYSIDAKSDILPFCVWADFITEQSSAICETILPYKLKASLMLRIREIAIRMMIWYKEHEIRLEMTPQVLDQFLMSTDWTVQGTIDEKKVAERLVQEEMIPVSQRYWLACAFFLELFIRPLLNQIPPEGRGIISYRRSVLDDLAAVMGLHTRELPNLGLVKIWTQYVDGSVEEFIEPKDLFWQHGFELAVKEGQRTAVFYCWKALSDIQKQEVIIAAAMFALLGYCESTCIDRTVYPRNGNIPYGDRKKVCIEHWECVGFYNTWCAVPEHYRDIFNFLFSQMTEEQKFAFFQYTFDVKSRILTSSFRQYLPWPILRNVTIGLSKLWGILPVKHFTRFLSTLSKRDINGCKYQDFDYKHLLLELLETTPDHYKTYLFRNNGERVQYEDFIDLQILLAVFKKHPFEQINIELIQIILQQATVEEKHALVHSDCGSEMCVYLMKNNKLEAVDLILEYCLSEEDIPNFKKEFLASQKGLSLCLEILEQENGETVHLLLQWGNFSESEISEIKLKMIREGTLSKLL